MLSFSLGAAVSSNGAIPVSNRHVKVALVGKFLSRTVCESLSECVNCLAGRSEAGQMQSRICTGHSLGNACALA